MTRRRADRPFDADAFRDARFAPRRLTIESRPAGELILTNPSPYSTAFRTAIELFDHWATAAPERVCLAERSGTGWRTVSYAEALSRIAALAGGLRDLHAVQRGPMLILSRNSVDHALITYAAMSQGLPAAPVSAQYGLPGANLARLAQACEVIRPGSVFVEDAALFAAALEHPALRDLPIIAGVNAGPGQVPLERLYRASSAPWAAGPNDLAKLMLTSGSTGQPKAVMMTHLGLATTAAQVAACFDDPEPPVMVHGAPWSHSLGGNSILHMGLSRGGTLYIDAGQPVASRFGDTIRNLSEISPTYQNMVPAGWMLLADALERDAVLARSFFERLRLMLYGGAALGQSTCDRIQAVAMRTVGEQISFSSGFGATETGPSACNVHWHNKRMGLIGLPLPGTSIKLAPCDGKLEIRVKGPQVTVGYYGQPQKTAESFDDEGFFKLGDAARLVDPANPQDGLIFDGRISENFKLSSGTFVNVGQIRVGAISEIGDAVTDAVVCGEGEAGVGLLLYPNLKMPRADVERAVREGLARFNAGESASTRIARALVLSDGPNANEGEITEKGYISQVTARRLRAGDASRLFEGTPDPQVCCL